MSFKTYLQTEARTIDLRLYEYLFESGDAQPVLDELTVYQNEDGGFGKALEPDLRLPDSSALATVVAFQYLAKLDKNDSDLVSKAITYFLSTYDKARQRWINIPPSADLYPRAPWWDYKEALEWAEWGNPSAEILGYLIRHADIVNNASFIEKIAKQATQRLDAVTEPEQHEVKCYIRLYENAPKTLQAKLHNKLATHIKELAKTNPKDWEGYVATPLTFVESPNSPFADLFDHRLLQENAAFIKSKLVNGDHWEPTWAWGQFEKEWAQAKKDWSGRLTVDNFCLLQAFGVEV